MVAEVKFIPETHLRQPRVIYSACRAFTESKEIIQILKQTGDSRYIYQNEHDTALHDKVIDIDKDLTYNEHQLGIASTVYKLFDKKSANPPRTWNTPNLILRSNN